MSWKHWQRAAVRGIAMLQGWRYDVFGFAALNLVEGRMGFAVKHGKLVMSEIDAATASAD
jgi:ribonuclease D